MRKEDVLFARSARASLFGKRTEDTRTKLAPETKDALRALWMGLGYQTESEFLAEHLETLVHGADHVVTLHRQRIEAVASIGKEKGPAQ